MAIRDIGVRTVIENLQGFLSGMGRYNAAIQTAEQRTQKFAERAGKAGRALTALSAPLIGIGFVATRSAIAFETAFIGVQKTVDATEEEFAELEKAIRRMAQEIPATAGELAALGETAGQLGIQVGAIEGFIRVVADLGVATNLSADQAAISLARLVTITGLSQSQFSNLGAVIVDLGNNFAATEAEILAFGLRIASAGTIAGITEANILSIGAAMSAVGIQAQAGGTAVQRVLLNMTEAVATTNEKLGVFAKTAGLSAQEFADLFERDAGEAFTRFVEGLGVAGDDAFIILRELGLEDQRLLRSFLSLATAGDLLRQSMTRGSTAFAENTALVTEAEKRYASAASQVAIARGKLNEMFITIGAALVPALLSLIDALTPILKVVGDLAKRFPKATATVIGLALVLGALGIALLAVSFIMPGIVAGVGLVASAFGFLSGGVAILTGAFIGLNLGMLPITLIVLGIAAAIAAVILVFKNWSTIVDFVSAAFQRLIKFLKDAVNLFIQFSPFTQFLRLTPLGGFGGVPQFAEGGIQQQSGMAIVGERGPEVVQLPAGAQVTQASRTTNFNVQANYSNRQDPQTIRLDLEAIDMMTRS